MPDALTPASEAAAAATRPGARLARRFYGHVHAFRAFAIMNVVALHTIGLWVDSSDASLRETRGMQRLARVNELLFHNSTIYFVLISGLLYALVLRNRGMAQFYRGKATQVLLPYGLLTLLFSALVWDRTTGWRFGLPPGLSLPQLALHNFFAGHALFVYWYVPVVTGLFLLTPWLHQRLAGPHGRRWLVGCLLLPLVFSRTGLEVSPSSVLYFLAPYALGLWLGLDYEARLAAVRRAMVPLLGVVLATLPALYVSLYISGTSDRPFFNHIELFFYLQKTAISLLVLLALRPFDAGVPRPVAILAEGAFAVYFLHVAFILAVLPSLLPLVSPATSWPWHALALVGLWALGILGSLAVTWALRRLIGTRSRYLVGA